MQTVVAPLTTVPSSRNDARWLRAGLAFVWLATGAAVLHPYYRKLGAESLAPLGLPPWVMVATCVGEIVLGLRVLLKRMDGWRAAQQAELILGFSAILTATQPELWLHPLGPLTKNLPLLAVVAVLWRVDRRGWDRVGEWTLRGGMAVIWLGDGVAAQFLYGLTPPEAAAGAGVPPPRRRRGLCASWAACRRLLGLAALGSAAGRGAWCCWSRSRFWRRSRLSLLSSIPFCGSTRSGR